MEDRCDAKRGWGEVSVVLEEEGVHRCETRGRRGVGQYDVR